MKLIRTDQEKKIEYEINLRGNKTVVQIDETVFSKQTFDEIVKFFDSILGAICVEIRCGCSDLELRYSKLNHHGEQKGFIVM